MRAETGTESAHRRLQERSREAPAADLLAGLRRAQKVVSPKYLYDEKGSQLFDAICDQPEYYPTRTELSIMQTNIAEISDAVGPHASLVEFGSGSSVKTRILLERLDRLAAYIPVDISEDHLHATAATLAEDFPKISILPVAADFTRPFELPRVEDACRNVVYFPGSTIGNFTPEGAQALLEVMCLEAGEGGALLIGVDLQKSRDILERAYNDRAGFTERFNLNMLMHLNRRFGADFDLRHFRHRAIYNEELGRIEMHLISGLDQEVSIGQATIRFVEGEYILSECSHKYTSEQFVEMAQRAGFEVGTVWTDPKKMFSVQYCTVRPKR